MTEGKTEAQSAGTLKVAIGVCTHNRGAGLTALLTILGRQRVPDLDDRQIVVIIADNSLGGSAKGISMASARSGRFAIEYVHEPRRGLAFARNAALQAAISCGATHLAFIDDDELPSREWLQSLLKSLTRSAAAAAIGPVYPIFASPPAAWLPTAAFATRREPVSGFVNEGYTCNSIIELAAVKRFDLAFDERFNETGGEDTFFFKKLLDCGGRIAWAEDAVVHEVVPGHRMSAMWLWRRWYRTGTLEAYLGGFNADSGAGRLINFGRGVARLGVGGIRIAGGAALVLFGQPAAFVASFYTFCRGAGLVASAFGYQYKEYAVPGYR